MRTPAKKCVNSGFTLIEIVMIMLILIIIAAVAYPRYYNLSTDAHKANVDGIAGSFRTAVALVQITCKAKNITVARDNIPSFGSGNVDVNANGFPTDTANSNVIGGNATRCVNVWNGILFNPPSVSTGTTADYRATAAGEVCTYAYQRNLPTVRSFTYNATTGAIAVTNP